jgi:hypothetical protein
VLKPKEEKHILNLGLMPIVETNFDKKRTEEQKISILSGILPNVKVLIR